MEQLAAIFGQLSEDLASIWNRTQLAPLYRIFVRPSCVLEDLRRHPTFSGWGMRHSDLFDNVTTYASSAYPSAFYHAANSSGPCNVRNNYWREVVLGGGIGSTALSASPLTYISVTRCHLGGRCRHKWIIIFLFFNCLEHFRGAGGIRPGSCVGRIISERAE